MQLPRGIAATIASVLVGMAGLLLNCTSASIASSDGVLGVLVLTSMAMIAVGYLPALRKWKGQQWATRLMNVAMLIFIVYVICVVGSSGS